MAVETCRRVVFREAFFHSDLSAIVEPEVQFVYLAGLILLLLVLGLAKSARRFDFGPLWLRRFKIEKHTLF